MHNLTPRQAAILSAVINEYRNARRPVGSKTIVSMGVVEGSPATVRSELNRLEQLGLLRHPHTSAGREPTDTGYRLFVDRILSSGEGGAEGELEQIRSCLASAKDPHKSSVHFEQVIPGLTQSLAELTGNLSVISSPRAEGSVIRHVEVLTLKASVIVVVVITETGDVVRHVVATEEPVDTGLINWAASFLNDVVVGRPVGRSLLHRLETTKDFSAAERRIIDLLLPVFRTLSERPAEAHIGGSREMVELMADDSAHLASLVSMIDERAALLSVLQGMVSPWSNVSGRSPGRRISISIGEENPLPALSRLSVVATSYGFGSRNLGVVGIVGPRSMNYSLAIAAVSSAATVLGDMAHDIYVS